MTIIDIVKYISILGLLRLNDMEKRKLMALGKSSIVIAIPKPWLRKSKLEKGDTVHLNIQSDGSLGVYPNSVEDKRNEIDLIIAEDDNKDVIIRRLISCYLNGFSLVHLSSKNIFSPIQQETIREITRTLYMRIMKASSKEITIQSTLDESMDSIFSGVERMHTITCSMCADVIESIKNRDKKLAEAVLTFENDVDQFMYFLLRLIRMATQNSSIAHKLGLDMLDCLDVQTLVHRIEKIADHVNNIAINLLPIFDRVGDEQSGVLSILSEAAEIAFNSYARAFDSFILRDITNVDEIIDNQKDVDELIYLITPLPFSGKLSERDNLCPICSIRESVSRISEYSGDIAELALDRALRYPT